MAWLSSQSDRLCVADKTVLVTGAAKRIGRAVSLAFASAGANVVVHYNRSESEAAALCGEIRERNVDSWAAACDLESPGDAGKLLDDAVSAAGKIDILVNNAAIFPEGGLASLGLEDVSRNMNVNALSPMVLSRAFASHTERGVIINLLDCRVCDYDRKHVAYYLSKQMLFSLTRLMAVEYGPGIRVNGVAPGLILPPPGKDESYLTEMSGTNPLNTYGSAEGVADAVMFLASAQFVTGQVIYVDGGRHLMGGIHE